MPLDMVGSHRLAASFSLKALGRLFGLIFCNTSWAKGVLLPWGLFIACFVQTLPAHWVSTSILPFQRHHVSIHLNLPGQHLRPRNKYPLQVLYKALTSVVDSVRS